MVRGGTRYRLVSDDLGSVRAVVEADTGAVVQELDYDPYGRTLRDTNPGFQPFGWAGGVRDTDTGLIRFGARDYDPDTGRWTSKDPIGFSGGDTNLYGYVLGDPVNLIDPTGLRVRPQLDGCLGVRGRRVRQHHVRSRQCCVRREDVLGHVSASAASSATPTRRGSPSEPSSPQ